MTKQSLQIGILCMCLAVAALSASSVAYSRSGNESAMRLLESSGFDAMLRLDARLDGTLVDGIPKSMPRELRAEIVGALDQTLGYAQMRRAVADDVSSRLGAAVIDRHLRWWASTIGQAASKAQFAAFRELTEPQSESAPSSGSIHPRSPNPAAEPVARRSAYALLLPDLVGTSRSARDCLGMIVSFRRECAVAQAAPKTTGAKAPIPDAADILLSQYASLSDADLAAFRAYLDSPEAREVVNVLGNSYLRTRLSKVASVQSLIADAVKRFAGGKIGSDAGDTLRKVIKLVDEDRSLDEARLILHFLRSVEPRNPRIFVELARVAIKQAAFDDRPPGGPPAVDPEFLDDAQGWIDRAIALDPGRADTLVLAGHLAYLKYQFPESIALLEEARRIGTTNPWLRLNLADALWALGRNKDMDRGYLDRAAKELEAALAKELLPQMRWHAEHSLAHIYGDLGDFAKARVLFQRQISSSTGYDKAEVLADYAGFLFSTTDDLDGAIAAAREATRLVEFNLGHSTLSEALLVKAERLYLAGQRANAAKLVREAQLAMPGLEQNYPSLARIPLTLPAVFALHEAGVIGDLTDSAGGLTLLLASAHAGAADIERLIKWRANPNYLDPEEGAPLHTAIRASNLAAVRTLLAHGADVSTRDKHGRLPLDLAEQIAGQSGARSVEILAVLRVAAGRNPAAAPVGTPLRAGYIYRVLKPISGDRYGHDLSVGMQVTFVKNCRYTDESLACLGFRKSANQAGIIDVAVEKKELISWQTWFEEIGPAPARAE